MNGPYHITKNPEAETELREYIKELTLDDIALEEEISIDFVREFRKTINWDCVFNTKYLNYQYDVVMSNDGLPLEMQIGPDTFEDWMRENYEEIWNEYYK